MEQILRKIGKGAWIVLLYTFNILADLTLALYDSLNKEKGFESTFAPAHSISRIYNKGLVITRYGKLSRKASFQGVLLCAQIGQGKTTRYLIKMVLSLKNACIICNDSPNEIAPLTSGMKTQQGFQVFYINFSDASKSSVYNPLSQIRRPDDINKIANMFVSGTLDKNGRSDPYWSLQSKVVICLMIRLVMYQPVEFRNMVNVLQLLKLFGAAGTQIDRMILQTHDKQLLIDYKAFLSTPSKTLHSIISSAKAALEMFESPEIAKVTSFGTSIDLDTFRKKPTILYLNNSIGDSKFTNLLNGLMMEQIYTHFLRKLPDKTDLDLFFIHEELAATPISILPLALSQCRKFRISNVCVIQDRDMLKPVYGEDASTIINNLVTHIYLPGSSNMGLLRDLEAFSGKVIHTDKDGTKRVKPLISAESIRTMNENNSIIVSSNKPIILARSSPYYKSWIYKPMTKIPQPPIESDIPEGPIPLIGIDPPKLSQSDEDTK